jgi:hypothetical protein
VRDATYYHHPDVAHLPTAEHAPRRFWAAEALGGAPIELVIDNGTAPKAAAVEAYANHGRWIAECPDCHGAQLTAQADPRFMCNVCANAGLGGLWRPVVWPKDAARIAALLDERPLAQHRNWEPGTTLRELKAGNLEHGVGALK